MEKVKVKDLALEFQVENKEIREFLTSNGFDVKNANSNVDEEGVNLVRKTYAGKAAGQTKPDEGKGEDSGEEKAKKEPPKKEVKPKTEDVREKAEAKETPADQESKAREVTAKEKDAASTAKAEGGDPAAKPVRPAAGTPAEGKPAAPKKKKVIIINNTQNSKSSDYQRAKQGGNRGGYGKPGNGTKEPNPFRPMIPKPVVKPVVVERVEYQGNRNVTGKPVDRKDTRNSSEQAAASASRTGTTRPQGDYDNSRREGERPVSAGRGQTDRSASGNKYSQGDRNGERSTYAGRPAGEKSYGNRSQGDRNSFQRGGADNRSGGYRKDAAGSSYNNDRGGRPGQGERNNFRKPQTSKDYMDTPIKDVEKHRKEEDRIKNQERDKRSKKDHIYEEDGANIPNKNKAGKFIKPEKKEEVAAEVIKVVTLPDKLTIRDLADKMKIQPSAIVKKLFLQGQIVTVNQEITFETAEEIAIEYDIICEHEVKVDVIAELLKEDEENPEDMTPRPPVICVMGHVDHGKTSLLDAIRNTNVTDREAGGITQHIGAYTVTINDQTIAFLDTPGHEAFTSMRMRGANATDIAILVVAADDGVMPQTVEAINHAKAAGVEIIVAVNKIDKPNANIDRVKQELAEYELIPEDWGGSTVFAPVSAKTGEGVQQLLEMILLTAEILELKANKNRRARGLVIEAELDKGRGPVATILVQKGTLRVGDFVSAGASYGKVRAMIDDKGRRIKEAGPSTPVEILGLSDVPEAGEVMIAHQNDKTAKSFAETFIAQSKEKMLEETKTRMSLDDLFNQIQTGNLKELNLIIKADVQGSVEAVKQSLSKLSNEEVLVKCIHGGVGAINESDVVLASASSAIIIGFNVRVDANAKATAEREGVDVRLYKVIYQAIEDVEAAMKGMLDPVFEEQVIGHAEVRQLFRASAVGNIAGSYVLDGRFERGCKIRITREGEQIYEGELDSLKRFKDDVKEVKAGFECGLVFKDFDAMQELDIVEAYIMVEVPR